MMDYHLLENKRGRADGDDDVHAAARGDAHGDSV